MEVTSGLRAFECGGAFGAGIAFVLALAFDNPIVSLLKGLLGRDGVAAWPSALGRILPPRDVVLV